MIYSCSWTRQENSWLRLGSTERKAVAPAPQHCNMNETNLVALLEFVLLDHLVQLCRVINHLDGQLLSSFKFADFQFKKKSRIFMKQQIGLHKYFLTEIIKKSVNKMCCQWTYFVYEVRWNPLFEWIERSKKDLIYNIKYY